MAAGMGGQRKLYLKMRRMARSPRAGRIYPFRVVRRLMEVRLP